MADADLIIGRQLPFAIERLTVNARAVETVEIAQAPVTVGVIDLGVLAAALLVLQDDAIGVGPAQRVALARDQRIHVAEAIIPADHKISGGARRHNRIVLVCASVTLLR